MARYDTGEGRQRRSSGEKRLFTSAAPPQELQNHARAPGRYIGGPWASTRRKFGPCGPRSAGPGAGVQLSARRPIDFGPKVDVYPFNLKKSTSNFPCIPPPDVIPLQSTYPSGNGGRQDSKGIHKTLNPEFCRLPRPSFSESPRTSRMGSAATDAQGGPGRVPAGRSASRRRALGSA